MLPNGVPNIIVPSLAASTAGPPPIRPTSRGLSGPSPSPGGPGDARSQHDVLQDFFTSLLTSRTGGAPASPGSGVSPTLGPNTNGAAARARKTSGDS